MPGPARSGEHIQGGVLQGGRDEQVVGDASAAEPGQRGAPGHQGGDAHAGGDGFGQRSDVDDVPVLVEARHRTFPASPCSTPTATVPSRARCGVGRESSAWPAPPSVGTPSTWRRSPPPSAPATRRGPTPARGTGRRPSPVASTSCSAGRRRGGGLRGRRAAHPDRGGGGPGAAGRAGQLAHGGGGRPRRPRGGGRHPGGDGVGVAFFGISGAFWGLAAGGTLHAVRRRRVRREASAVSGRRVSGRAGRGRWSGSRVRRRSR